MKKEVRIGIVSLVIFLGAWAGIRFLSGSDIFGRTNAYYVYYDNANGLQNASQVVIRGVKVGQVVDIAIAESDPTKVEVELAVSKDYQIPVDSKAKSFSASIMGGQAIEIIVGQSKEYIEPNGTIEAAVEIGMMDMVANEFGDIKEKLMVMVDNINTTLTTLNSLVDSNSAAVTSAVAHLNGVLADLEKSNIISNIDSFTGTLKQNGEKIDGIVSGAIASETISKAGDYSLERLGNSGLYTLVAVAYNAAGENVNETSVVFGYLKNGDKNPVDINCGLIVSDKYAKEGYTSENSLEFYIHGSNITKACYGLYRKKDFEEKYESVLKDLMSYEASEEELEGINGYGLTDLFIRLNSGMEYVLSVYASNGFEEKIIHAEAKLAGELNPLQMTYELDMLKPAKSKADYCRDWEFWSGTPDSNGRYPVGPVTITDGGKDMVTVEGDEEIEVEYLNVKGFYKPVVDEGYITDDTMKWQYYEGAIVPLHGRLGEFRNTSGELLTLEMISFFTSGNGGYADGAVCGAFTDEGNIAFVDMETGNYDDEGGYWFTALGVFDSKGNYKGEMISYDEMMFLDPANAPEIEEEETGVVSMLKEVKMNFQKNYNYVEYKQFQLYRAIDEVFGKEQVPSFSVKAGLDIEFERGPVKCSLQPADASAGIFSLGKPGAVSLRK